MSQTITIYSIYWDAQDRNNAGWAYRVTEGASGAIDGQAADALYRLTGHELCDSERTAILEAIGATALDTVAVLADDGVACDLWGRRIRLL